MPRGKTSAVQAPQPGLVLGCFARSTSRMAKPSFRFGKRRRLTRDSEFKRVRESGRAVSGHLFTMAVLRLQTAEPFRFGIVTSRKIGGAVVRNRVRRRLREIARRHQHGIAAGIWIAMVARAPAASATYRQLEDEWLRLAQRASILTT
jgi:ribonuclease P protein component